MNNRRQLEGLDVERVRFSQERELADALTQVPGFALHRRSLVPRDGEVTRRQLLATSLRLTASMAPQAYAQAETARRVLGGFEGQLELYQSSGRENAALHLVERPILLEIQGRMLSLLDTDAGIALFGHELGHYLAHGPWTELGATAVTGQTLAEEGLLSSRDAAVAMRLILAREVTADRFGLLACQDLDAALRLEMVAVTGLSGDALTWDTQAYLEQSRQLMEQTLAQGQRALATTHPEHSLRAWALWLFSETDVYRALVGKGSGQRSLADVDELIARALGTPELDLRYDVRAEPPAFLWECALACAVIVAMADGELNPSELDAIEDAFSRTVPGWSEFLDENVARECFYETGGMVRAAGPDLVRGLFLVLTHVIGADDVVDAREVEMVLAIGDALGYRSQFRAWLQPTLAVMQVDFELDLDAVTAPTIPLPIRSREVDEALEALCDQIERRGEMHVSPRRLLRLAGKPETAADGLAQVIELFAARNIESHPAIDNAALDQMLRLTAPQRTAPSKQPVELDASRQALLGAITKLRDELVSGDGRSPAVRLRSARPGRVFDLTRLDQIRPGTAERVVQLLSAGRSADLVSAEDAGRHDVADACSGDLRTLHRANADRQEETGANDLYFGYPVVVGNVAPRGAIQTGYGVRAPLVLYPVELQRDGRGKRGFSLRPRSDENPMVNQSLLQVLFNKANLALPDALSRELDELAADPDQANERLLEKLAEVGVHIRAESTTLVPFGCRDHDLDVAAPFLALEECALLGVFPQSSSDLLQDYDALLRELADPEREISELLAAAVALLPTQEHALPDSHDDAHDETVAWPVVSADPSQREAMAACRRGLVTVVDGPPGTGKSQLIVNLVADALRRGQRVAVVAEKRAALDVVYQRLHGRGLAGCVAVVHDVHDDRKALYRSLQSRLEAPPIEPGTSSHQVRARTEYERVERELARETTLLGQAAGHSGMKVGQLLAIAANPAQVVEEPGLADLDLDGLRQVLDLVNRLHVHRELWGPQSWWRQQGPRASLANFDDASLQAAQVQLCEAATLADRFEALLMEAPASEHDLAQARAGLVAVAATKPAYSSTEGARILAALVTHGDPGVADLRKTWSSSATALVRWNEPTGVLVHEDLARRVAVLASYAGRFARFFAGIWWKTRKLVRQELVELWPERAGASFDTVFLQELRERIDASRAWAQSASVYSALKLPELAPTSSDDAELRLSMLSTLASAAAVVAEAGPHLLALGLSPPRDASEVATFATRLEQRIAQLQAMDALRSSTASLASTFSWVASTDAAGLRSLTGHVQQDAKRLRDIDAWLAILDGLTTCGRSLLDAVCTAAPDASLSQWREAIVQAWAQAHLGRASAAEPALTQLGSAAFDQGVVRDAEMLRRTEAEVRDLEVERIVTKVASTELLQISQANYRARRTEKQRIKEEILKQVRKQRSLWPLRRFVREFADAGLLDALPCWLLSPETMTVLFPREPLFDLVIFDEASQCTVESGLPVLLRAKRAVIAGDEKQMPPSAYFKLSAEGTDEEDRSEEERRVRALLSDESLLSLARARCQHVGLAWHYRCLDESLIAFSNHAMYDGELRTIPSTMTPDARCSLRWIHVENGQYDSGLNRPEAERVVDLIAELLARQPRPTLGVVAFNLRQRQAILDAIDARGDADPAFAELWQAANDVDARDQRPFVKNLETVQGDERDIIVFSLGHAPIERRRAGGQSERYVPARFGPLALRGGERRLNVAVSRAKSEQYVVASFAPELLHVGRSRHDGPRLFRAYLDFVHAINQGHTVRAERVLDDVRGRPRVEVGTRERRIIDGYMPVASQIALALEDAGLRIELDLGTSGFRVPLALGPAGAPHFRLAVLTDEGADDASVFERHIHRPAILGLRGWDVMRVTAATWARRRSDVLDEIRRRVGTA